MRTFLPVALAAAALCAFPAAATEEIEPDPARCSAELPQACLDGVGGGVTSLDSLRVTTSGRGTLAAEGEERVQLQARARLPGGTVGAAASSHSMAGWTVWGSAAWSGYDSTVAIAPYEADTYNLLAGADRFLGERFLVGFNLSYETTDTETRFNGGGQDRDGIGVGLYGAFLVNDVFSIDAALGYAAMDTDETRIDPGTGRTGAPTPGALILGSYDSERAYATVNLNAVRAFGSWVLGARVGALHAVESQDAYAETGGTGRRNVGSRHIDLTQGYAGIDLGYSAGAFEPYVLLSYRNDFGRDDGNSAGGLPGGVRPQPDDDDEWQGGIGVRYFGASGITGSLEWLLTEGRDEFDEDSVTLSLRVPF